MTTKKNVKVRVGRVISDKMQKTVIVAVASQYTHPLYKKILRRIRKYKAHNEGLAKAGDMVRIIETRPLSKEKRWRVAEVITKGEIVQLPKEVVEAPPIEKIEPIAAKAEEEAATSGSAPAVEDKPTPAQDPPSAQ